MKSFARHTGVDASDEQGRDGGQPRHTRAGLAMAYGLCNPLSRACHIAAAAVPLL